MNVSAALRNNALKKLGSRWSGKIPETEAEARKAYLPYKIVTYVGMVGMTFFYFYLTSHPHHVEDKKVPYPYLKVMYAYRHVSILDLFLIY